MTCQNCSRKETCQLRTPYEKYLESKKEGEKEPTTLTLDQAGDVALAMLDKVSNEHEDLQDAAKVMEGAASLIDMKPLLQEARQDAVKEVLDFCQHFDNKKVVPP